MSSTIALRFKSLSFPVEVSKPTTTMPKHNLSKSKKGPTRTAPRARSAQLRPRRISAPSPSQPRPLLHSSTQPHQASPADGQRGPGTNSQMGAWVKRMCVRGGLGPPWMR